MASFSAGGIGTGKIWFSINCRNHTKDAPGMQERGTPDGFKTQGRFEILRKSG
jgi:hypothetical protein